MLTERAKTHYETLGVAPTASRQDIISAYREEVKKCHPDANPDDPNAASRFRSLSHAYSALSKPEQRGGSDQSGIIREHRKNPTQAFSSHVVAGGRIYRIITSETVVMRY